MTLHTLGVSLAAANDKLTASATRVGKSANNGVGGSATVWTNDEKRSPSNAAFVNGTVADILDWEKCSWAGHPSAGVFPVFMAMAEDRKATGRAYLEAVVATLEVYQRVAMAVQPADDFDHNQHGQSAQSGVLAPHYTNTSHVIQGNPFIISNTVWNKLSPERQEIFHVAAGNMEEYTEKKHPEITAEYYDWFMEFVDSKAE